MCPQPHAHPSLFPVTYITDHRGSSYSPFPCRHNILLWSPRPPPSPLHANTFLIESQPLFTLETAMPPSPSPHGRTPPFYLMTQEQWCGGPVARGEASVHVVVPRKTAHGPVPGPLVQPVDGHDPAWWQCRVRHIMKMIVPCWARAGIGRTTCLDIYNCHWSVWDVRYICPGASSRPWACWSAHYAFSVCGLSKH